MTIPELAPRRRFTAIVATSAFALLVAIAIAVLVPVELRSLWFGLAGGATVICAFVAHLVDGRAEGFIFRVSIAALGGITVLGIVALISMLTSVTAVPV